MRDCLDSQTLSEYISTIVLDDNEKLSIKWSARGIPEKWDQEPYVGPGTQDHRVGP